MSFFSSAHGTFSRIDHILGHTSSLCMFEQIEIISSIFSDHNAVRLDANHREKKLKNTNIRRLNSMLLNNQQIMEEMKKWNENMHRNQWKWKHYNQKPMGFSKSSAKRKVLNNTSLAQETREKSNK